MKRSAFMKPVDIEVIGEHQTPPEGMGEPFFRAQSIRINGTETPISQGTQFKVEMTGGGMFLATLTMVVGSVSIQPPKAE
jgi:hypothetical protein